jgi:hypothetical protein
MNQFQQNLLEAIETVSAWDLPEDEFADAVNAQARFLLAMPYWVWPGHHFFHNHI